MMRLNTFMRASVVAGGLATTALLGGGTAFAATSATVTPSSSLCHVRALYGNTPINADTSTNSVVVGNLTKGVTYDAGCSVYGGGVYSACGANDSRWYYVNTGHTTGYVKYPCVEHTISG